MSDKAEIRVTGNSSSASASFKQVAEAGKAMADTLDRSSRQASQSVEQLGQDANKMGREVEEAGQKSVRSLKEIEDRAKAVGAGIGTLVGGVAIAGRAFQNQEQQIRGLNRAYGESSDQIQRFAQDVQNATVYSDDAVRQSAQLASTLTRTYGLTTEQVQALIRRTADLASVNVDATGRQFDLVDAVQRTSSALRGEGESAEALGLTMSDSALAAAAAARGLAGWTTTMTEAEKAQFRFTYLMEQSTYAMGAAEEAADTNAGKARQLINDLQDQAQAFGGLTGAAGEYLSVLGQLGLALPLVGAGLGKVTAGMAATGISGGTAGLVGLLAFGGLEAYRTANGQGLTATGSSPELSAWNAFWGGYADVWNFALPGNPFNSQKYGVANDANKVEDVLKSLFFVDPMAVGDNDKAYGKALYERLITFGVIPQSQYTDNRSDRDEQLDIIKSKAAASGLTLEQYITSYLTAPGSSAIYDPVSQKYMDLGEYQIYTGERTRLRSQQIGTGATTYTGSPGGNQLQGASIITPTTRYYGDSQIEYTGPYQPRMSSQLPTQLYPMYNGPYQPAGNANQGRYYGDVSRGPTTAYIDLPTQLGKQEGNQSSMAAMQAGSVNLIREQTAALEAQYGAYSVLFDGIVSVNDAQTAFAATQTGLSSEMSVYQGQASEWTSELNAQEKAYEILQKRQEEGKALTAEQTEFMKNYANAVEIGTGAVEDATIAGGIAAQNMLLNKSAMDTFKEGTGEVTDAILLLIATLGGVPDDVRTKITLDGAEAFHSALDAAVQHLNNVDGQTAHFYINTQQTGVSIGNPNGPSIDNNPARLGGVIGYRNGGIPVELAEAGPELLHFRDGGSAWAMNRGRYSVPPGTYVDTAPASKLKAAAPSSGGGITITGPVYIYPATGDVQREFTSALVGDWRS